MTKQRTQYIYKLVGQILNKKQRQKPKYQQYFYQLNVHLKNKPELGKIFAFKSKLENSSLWKVIEQNNFLGKQYQFFCRNYQGYYYLVDWKETDK